MTKKGMVRFVLFPWLVQVVRGLSQDVIGPGVMLKRAATAQVAVGRALMDTLPQVVRSDAGIQRSAARVCRRIFEELGPAYIKLGQLIASSPTAFPAEIVEEFAACLDRTPVADFEKEILPVIERDLGGKLREIFWSFDPTPLASASVAQVHGAVMRQDDGSLIKVAVKVRKAGVADSLNADLQFVSIAANALEAVAPQLGRINLANLISDLRESILGELDFKEEATRLNSFQQFLDAQNFSTFATVPRPIRATAQVLVMTRLDGLPLSNYVSDRTVSTMSRKTKNNNNAPNKDIEQAIATLLRVWAASVLYHDFFHADVHGSNCFLLHDGRIALLDFGIVGTLPPATYTSVLQMADAYNSNDDYGLAKSLVNLQVATNDVDLDAFALDLRRALSTNTQSAATLVSTIIDLAETYSLELPREFGILLKQALYLAGYIDQLAPGLDVFQNPTAALLEDQSKGQPSSSTASSGHVTGQDSTRSDHKDGI